MTTDQHQEILRTEGLSKFFPGVKALDNVNFSLRRGEIMALLGENGAGKSTLIKALTGVYHAERGAIWLEGQQISPVCGAKIRDRQQAPAEDGIYDPDADSHDHCKDSIFQL